MAKDQITRKSVSLPDRMWADIAEFRFRERITAEAEAVRRLLRLALDGERVADGGGGRKRDGQD